MTDHPITPPPELVQQWFKIPGVTPITKMAVVTVATNRLQMLATEAARWGADQELEACCVLMDEWGIDGEDLMAVRRPKPLSLKEQALHALLHMDQGQHNERAAIVRRALEQLDD